MKKKDFTSPIWDIANVVFSIIAAITTIIFCRFFVLSFTIENTSPAHSFALGMCGVFASLASAFFIAVFIRVLDMKKKRNGEQSALILLKPNLFEVYTAINMFFPQMMAFTTIHSNNTITYPSERIYYTNISENDGNRDFIDFIEAFRFAEKT